MSAWYREDLAYIHDVGHSDYALKSAPEILNILTQHGIQDGLIVDLGCGSGLSAQVFTQANYRVLGVDISEALIAIARTRVPTAEFRVESLLKTKIPTCQAVTSIGECPNYLFDADNNLHQLTQLFQQIHTALVPGGIFIFDIAEPGQVQPGEPSRGFTEGPDWIILLEKSEDPAAATLMRRITTLRRVGDAYRRDDEVHRLQLYHADEVAAILEQVRFQVRVMRSYGSYELPPAHAAFIAHKPH